MNNRSKLGWYVHRLRAMSPSEILLRVRERLLKADETRQLKRFHDSRIESLSECSLFPHLPEASDFTEDQRCKLEDACDQIRKGHWPVLGGHLFEVSSPPEWHRDHLCGKEVEDRGAAKHINHRELPTGIDPRIVWEVNRWAQYVRLAQSAWLRGKCDNVELIINDLENWVKENPLGHGINWTSPMEPAIRLINYSWIHSLVSVIPLDEGLQKRLDELTQAIVPGHSWWVWRYHSVGTSANNHLLGELAGLMVAQARWPECSEYSTSFSELSDILCKELIKQFSKDGGNREQALHYHLFAWEMGWQSLLAMRSMSQKVPPEVEERMARGAYFFSEMVSPNEPWDFGDSDDAHVTPVFLNEGSCLAEWRDWMRGEAGYISRWFGEAPRSDSGTEWHGQWQYFPDSGYAVMKNDLIMLRLDGSPLGYGAMAAHGHLDAMHLSIWVDDKALVIDPGTGSYFDNREVRDYYLSAEAHNGPCLIDSSFYPKHVGPFLWANHHSHTEWKFSDDGPRVTLTLGEAKVSRGVKLKGGLVIVEDRVQGYQGRVANHWKFAPSVRATSSGTQIVLEREGIKSIGEFAGGTLQLNTNASKESSGLCSEFFRSEQYAPVAINETETSQERCMLTTKFKLKD